MASPNKIRTMDGDVVVVATADALTPASGIPILDGSGKVRSQNIPFGTTSVTVAAGDDARFGKVGEVQDEGLTVLTSAAILNFVGAGVVAADAGGGVATITIPGGISGVPVQDEGIAQGTATTFNFVGALVTAAVATGTATVTITGPMVKDEGVNVANANTINFVGSYVVATTVGNDITVTISDPTLPIQNNGSAVATLRTLNFVSDGGFVVATDAGSGVASIAVDKGTRYTLSASQTGAATGFSFSEATYRGVVLDYCYEQDEGKQVGTIMIVHSGSTPVIRVDPLSIGTPGVTFTVDVNSGNARLLYTNGATGGTAIYLHVKARLFLFNDVSAPPP